MGDVVSTNRFRRVSARERERLRARFARRRPWQIENERALREFDRIVAEAPARRRGGRK